MFIGTTYGLERGLVKALLEHTNCKVVLTGSDWSKFSDEIDINKYPILRANPKEVKLVEQLKASGRIDLIICHYHNNRIGMTHEYWRDKLGIPVYGNPPAADLIDYTNGQYMEEFKSDIFFVGGKWNYKAKTIDPWFMPLCDSELGLNVKIFGNKHWGCPQFCGALEQRWVKHAMASAKVCPNISELHAQSFGIELNERCFKLLSNKCPVVSDYTESLATDIYNNGEIEFAKTPKEFKEKILGVIDGSLTIDREKGYSKTLRSETYFHRVASLFERLGLEKEKVNVLNRYSELRVVNNI